MPTYNLYPGTATGKQIDENIARVNATPQDAAIPFVWCITVSLTGTAGGSAFSTKMWHEPSGSDYQHFPLLTNCEVLDVEFSNPSIVSSVSISATGTNKINYVAEFNSSGSTDIFIYLIEGAGDPDNP